MVTTSTGSFGRMPFRIASGIFFSGGVSMVLFEMTILKGKAHTVSRISKEQSSHIQHIHSIVEIKKVRRSGKNYAGCSDSRLEPN